MQPKSRPAIPFCVGTAPHTPIGGAGTCPVLVGLIVALAGCSGSGPSPTSLAVGPEKVRVRVACLGEPTATMVRRHGRSWASRTGGELEVVAYDPGQGPQAGLAADVWVIAPAELARWVAVGQCNRCPPYSPARTIGTRGSTCCPFTAPSC